MSSEVIANILLVDDHPGNLLVLEHTLKGLGQNLVQATSGAEALRHVLTQDFAVILLDVKMPDIDGFETARLIREREQSRHTPIIFLTALSGSDEDVIKGYTLGAVDFMLKPFLPEVLRWKVAVFVELFQKTEEVKWQLKEIERLNREERERILRQQQEVIRELSTPVLQVRERLLILPIVGAVDPLRARQLIEKLLYNIRVTRAKVVVIDITGVPTIDTTVANYLVKTVETSRMMGAAVLLTGLSAEIALTLVTIGVDLTKINTVGDLQGGIEEAERLLGYKVIFQTDA